MSSFTVWDCCPVRGGSHGGSVAVTMSTRNVEKQTTLFCSVHPAPPTLKSRKLSLAVCKNFPRLRQPTTIRPLWLWFVFFLLITVLKVSIGSLSHHSLHLEEPELLTSSPFYRCSPSAPSDTFPLNHPANSALMAPTPMGLEPPEL